MNARARDRSLCAGVLALTLLAVSAQTHAQRRSKQPLLDPAGTWSCVVYGHPAFGDERVLMQLTADGSTALSRETDAGDRFWDPLSPWTADDDKITFSDSRTGRQFAADLRRATLGGSWRTVTLIGGWWCTSIDDAAYAGIPLRDTRTLMPPLVPIRTATPAYPVQAIRDAKQGRAVTCFFVDASGGIVKPEIIELSDEIFRAPTLAALERSQYHGWDEPGVVRPGCRTYIYRLDSVRELAAAP
jgi:hypothetical protein